MKYIYLCSIIFLIEAFSLQLRAQNLVPNPSFEFYSSCPTDGAQMSHAMPWFSPTVNTPDYCNACYIGPSPLPVDVPTNFCGYQQARTGVAYADLVVFALGNTREYIEVKLIDSLRTDRSYCVTFYVSNADSCKWATSRIGAYFSSDSIYNYSTGLVLNYVPQVENLFGNIITDATNWTKISGSFTATGGERFMTIGNFYDNANTDTLFVGNYFLTYGYLYIDDISVYELPQDSTSCFDGVSVNEIEKGGEILVYPNPAKDNLKIAIPSSSEKSHLSIYNILGKQVLEKNFSNQRCTVNLSGLAEGIYFIRLLVNGELRKTEKILIER